MRVDEVKDICRERGFDVIIVGPDFDKSILEQMKSMPGMTVLQQFGGNYVNALREPRPPRPCHNGPRDRFGRLK